jgi:hypothetical protein
MIFWIIDELCGILHIVFPIVNVPQFVGWLGRDDQVEGCRCMRCGHCW